MKVATEYMANTFENFGVCFFKKDMKLGRKSGGDTREKLEEKDWRWIRSKHPVYAYGILKQKVLSKNK